MSEIKFNRVWSMPNKNTFEIKPIKELLERYITPFDEVVDPFANKNKYGSITNDLDDQYDTDYHMEATDFLKMLGDKSADVVLYDPPYCYDEETEVFTNNGWKYIKDVQYSDFIATLNTETNKLEYHKPIEIICKNYCGNMVSIDSQSINLLVTPNHRCYVKNGFYKDFHWMNAIDLFTTSSKHWFKKACLWDGIEQEYFYLPEVKLDKTNRYGENVKKEKPIKMDLWLKFLGLYLSEGSYKECVKKENNRHWRYVVSIAQVKEYGRQKIREVLDEMGYKYSQSKNCFRIEDKQLWTYVSQFGKTFDKFIPEEIKQLSSRQLQILIDYLMIGDGCHITYPKLNNNNNKMYHYTTNNYSTASNFLMNDFCEIAIKAGHAITVTYAIKKPYDTKVYGIHMLKAKDFMVNKKNFSIINYEGNIYCLTVPNSTMFVKRKGRCFWCGNSPRQVSECYKNFGLAVNKETTQSSYWTKQKAEIARIIKPNGIVISFGWNSGGIGKTLGFSIEEILLVPHGGIHNDTIVTVERKIK